MKNPYGCRMHNKAEKEEIGITSIGVSGCEGYAGIDGDEPHDKCKKCEWLVKDEPPCENNDCEFNRTLAKKSHCDAENYCGGYYFSEGGEGK